MAVKLLKFSRLCDQRLSQLLTKLLALLPADEQAKPSKPVINNKELLLSQLPADICTHLHNKYQQGFCSQGIQISSS